MVVFTKEYLSRFVLEPLLAHLSGYRDLFFNFLLVAIILFSGWIIAKIVQIIVRTFLRLIRFDSLCEKTKITQFLETGGLYNIPSTTFSNFIYWIILFVVFTLGMNVIAEFDSYRLVERILKYISNTLIGLFLIIIGVAIGNFLSKLIKGATVKAGVRENVAIVFEKLVLIIIVLFAAYTAIAQTLRIPDRIISVIIEEFFKYGFLGIAIAIGIGAKGIVSNFLAAYRIKALYPKGTEIIFDDTKGIVKEIQVSHTLIYTTEGIISIPNDTLVKKIIKKQI